MLQLEFQPFNNISGPSIAPGPHLNLRLILIIVNVIPMIPISTVYAVGIVVLKPITPDQFMVIEGVPLHILCQFSASYFHKLCVIPASIKANNKLLQVWSIPNF